MAQYEAAFDWPYPAGDVILTGDFDNWAKSMHLTRSGSGFTGTVKVPYNSTVHYKFVVDGEWRLRDDLPQEANDVGIVNNVIQTPWMPESANEISQGATPDVTGAPVIVTVAQEVIAPKPSGLASVPRPLKEPAEVTAPVPAISASVDTAKDVVNAAHVFVNGINGPSPTMTPDAERPPESALPPSGDVAPGEKSSVSPLAINPVVSPTEEAIAEIPTPGIKEVAEQPPPFKEPSLLTSVASNVASNVGLALKSLTGIDPINSNKIPIPPDTASPQAPVAIQGSTAAAPTVKDAEPVASQSVAEPTPANAPVTPTKGKEGSKRDSSPRPTSTKSFPTVGSSHSTPSKEGSTRQKRPSFFGKVKNIFFHSHNGEGHSKK